MLPTRLLTSLLLILIALAAMFGIAAGQESQPATPDAVLRADFTYQGSLRWNGSPANGPYDFQFSLHDAASGGSQVGYTINLNDVTVTGGIFTVALDFGTAAFRGEARWLEVAVRPGASTGTYSVLSPRQPLTAVPYALYAANAWSTTGNAGTTPGTAFLGTTDNRALELKVNGQRALRLEPATATLAADADAPPSPPLPERGAADNDAPAAPLAVNSINVIAGYRGNSVAAGKLGQTIAGGGSDYPGCGPSGTDPCVNKVTEDYGTVGGGAGNTAYWAATVIGGYSNTASGGVATVAGGIRNTANGNYATVVGGYENTANGQYSFAAGYRAKANADGAFVWADSTAADFISTVPDSFNVRATGGARIVTKHGFGLEVDNWTDGTPADNGDGIRAYANASRGNNWAALYADNEGTSPAVYAFSNGTYSGYFQKNIFVAGDCHGCALAYVAVNNGDTPLEAGDLVAADGIQPPLAAGSKPVLGVRRASAAAIGVVAGRAVLVESAKDGQTTVSAEAAEGVIAPGDYLFIVVSGVAQARVDASTGPIAAGQRLTTAARAGHARAQRTVSVEGVQVAEATDVIGVALEALPAGQGLIWILVAVR